MWPFSSKTWNQLDICSTIQLKLWYDEYFFLQISCRSVENLIMYLFCNTFVSVEYLLLCFFISSSPCNIVGSKVVVRDGCRCSMTEPYVEFWFLGCHKCFLYISLSVCFSGGGTHCVFKWILRGHYKPTPNATI